MFTIDNDTTMPIVRRAPRYAEVGQAEIAPAPHRTVGRPFPRTQNGVTLVPVGLLEDAIDPRTEDPDAEMAELEPRDYAAIYAEVVKPPADETEIARRLTLLEQHVRPGIPLAQILTAADLLGIGRSYDLAHFLAANQTTPAGVDLTLITDQWGRSLETLEALAALDALAG